MNNNNNISNSNPRDDIAVGPYEFQNSQMNPSRVTLCIMEDNTVSQRLYDKGSIVGDKKEYFKSLGEALERVEILAADYEK
jgi:hypothetical protein